MAGSHPKASYWLLLLAAGAGIGCSDRLGRIDTALRERLARETQDIRPLDLAARSSRPPHALDDAAPGALDDIAPGSTALAAAPATLALSLSDLRMAVLEHNLELAVARLDPALAAERVSEEEAKFDATIFAGAQFEDADLGSADDEIVALTSDAKELDKQIAKLTRVPQQKEEFGGELGVRAPLPTGGEITLANELDVQRKSAPQAFSESFDQYRSALRFSLVQPLLRDAGMAVNTASIRLARLRAAAVSTRTKLAMVRVLAAAEKAYWRTYAARRALEVRAQQYALARDNLELVERRVAEGLSAPIELTRAEVGVAQRVDALIVARTALRLQQRELKRLLNLPDVPLDADTELAIESSPQLLRFELDRTALVADALEHRMELLELELELAAEAVRVDYARNQTLPLFAFEFQYGLMDRAGSLGSAWDGMWDFDQGELAVGLRGELPVTNQARLARLRQAVLARTQRLASRGERAQLIRQEVHDATDVLEQNWQRILAARRTAVVSGVNYEAELTQFREGLRTMREVLEALSDLGDAQLGEIRTVVAYQVAQIDLAFATGTLLGYARVGLEPLPIDVRSDR